VKPRLTKMILNVAWLAKKVRKVKKDQEKP